MVNKIIIKAKEIAKKIFEKIKEKVFTFIASKIIQAIVLLLVGAGVHSGLTGTLADKTPAEPKACPECKECPVCTNKVIIKEPTIQKMDCSEHESRYHQ